MAGAQPCPSPISLPASLLGLVPVRAPQLSPSLWARPGWQHPPGKGHLLPWQQSCHVTKILSRCHKPHGAASPGRAGAWSKLWPWSSLCPSTVTVWRANSAGSAGETGPSPRAQALSSEPAGPAVPVPLAVVPPQLDGPAHSWAAGALPDAASPSTKMPDEPQTDLFSNPDSITALDL